VPGRSHTRPLAANHWAVVIARPMLSSRQSWSYRLERAGAPGRWL